MKKVFVTRNILLDGITLLKKNNLEVEVWSGPGPIPREELMAKAKGANALITMLSDRIDADFLNANSHLKAISNYAVGLNNIDLKRAAELNIKIGNTPDVLTEATAEVAMGLMIAAARNFKAGHINASSGEWKTWEPMGLLGISLYKKKLGIIGAGRIGKRFAEMAHGAFSMEIKPYKRGENLADFLAELDVVSLHVPLTNETREMLGPEEFKAMKKNAILINTARGEVINQDALYEVLKSTHLFAAGLDVTSPEPLPSSHPLYSLPNVMILPHIASATFEARSQMSLICGKNILHALSEY